ncbi:MAG: hypothetical protein QM656_03660 [Paracoccaceae bacterium]
MDTDLCALPVTVGVGRLAKGERRQALSRGLMAARAFRARGLIEGAALFLQGEAQTIGDIAVAEAELA